jgi:hypothetical protein
MKTIKKKYQLAGVTVYNIYDQAFGDDEYYLTEARNPETGHCSTLSTSMMGYLYDSLVLDKLLNMDWIDQAEYDKAYAELPEEEICPS